MVDMCNYSRLEIHINFTAIFLELLVCISPKVIQCIYSASCLFQDLVNSTSDSVGVEGEEPQSGA